MPRPVAAGAVALALCSGVLAGCGGSSSKASGGGDGDHVASGSGAQSAPALPADKVQRPACGLLTQAEVEAAVGARVSAPKQGDQEARSLCGFTLASATDQSVVVVSTSSGVPGAFAALRDKAVSPQPVGGGQGFVSGGQALVHKGNTMVAILVALRQTPAQLTVAATKLAQAVGNRL